MTRVAAASSGADAAELAADDVGDLGDGQIDHTRASQRGREFVTVVEGPGLAVAGLPGLVALAGDQHDVSRSRPRHRVVDRLAPVTDLDHLAPRR